MRSFLKTVLNGFSYIVSILFRYEIIKLLSKVKKLVIWHAVKGKFASIGSDSFIEWPFLLSGPQNIRIGNNFTALSTLRIETFAKYGDQVFQPELIIGNNVSFNNDCHIGCINRIEIGNNVLAASRIYISDHFHGKISSDENHIAAVLRPLYSKGPVIIRDNVWIGEGVVILPGVTIGENSIIGANSVVSKDVPANAVVAGVPAVLIKYLA